MQVNNQRVKGDLEKAGEIAEVFQRMRHTIQRNDGTRSFEWVTDTCHDQQVPFTKDKETRSIVKNIKNIKNTRRRIDVLIKDDDGRITDIETKGYVLYKIG